MKTRTVQLGDVLKVDRSAASEAECASLPYVGLDDIEKDAGNFTSDFRRKPEPLLATKFCFTSRHVLYGKLRPYLNKVALPDFDGVCTTEVLPLLPDETVLARGYLFALLLSSGFVKWASQRVSGANLPRLDPGLLEEFEVTLPPLSEQQRIAGVLEQADRLRRTRRYALELSDSFLPAAFRATFGSEAECLHRWPVVRLDDCCKRITDGTHLTPKFGSEGVPFIFVKNIENGRIDFATDKFISKVTHQELYRRCPVECGDVLYTIVGATYGQAALVEDFTEFAFQRHIAHLKPDPRSLLPKFFATIMQLPIIKTQADRWARGAAQPTVNLKELKEFLLPLPPLALQQQFASLVSRHERLWGVQRESLRQAEHLFQSLLHRAFTTGL